MPGPYPPYIGTPEQQLKAFLRDARRVMEFTVLHREHLMSPWIMGDTGLMEQLDSAWTVVNGRFDSVLQAQWPQTVLIDAGLTGPELHFKLGVFRKLFDPFRKVLDWGAQKLAGLTPTVWKKIREWLRELLDMINGIMKSLLKIAGMEAIEEFKTALEKLLDKLDDPDLPD